LYFVFNNSIPALKRREIIPYNPKLKELARKLRNDSTFTEILLWNYLKKKQMRGYDFDRQKPIDNYIVDFYCKELKLAIEIDGESHYGKEYRDKIRDKRLNKLGITVLRFDDLDVRYKLDQVLEEIENWINSNAEKLTHP
jgi:very-short-patch-repair endonuclease